MFENVTYEIILKRMLNKIKNSMDKREGSVIFDSLAPAAIEFQNLYLQGDVILNETFADTASRPYLIERCKERGVLVKTATPAIRQGKFNMDVPIGSRYSLNKLNYVAIEKISDCVFKMQCETAGSVGNLESGTLIPIDYLEGLQTATLTDVLIPGEDDEDTETLRQRYFDSFKSQSFGGNVSYYKESVNSLDGVGGVKVKRAWNGGGTVKLVIIDSEYNKPSDVLIGTVQEAVDPLEHQGDGLGIAPIDHIVTVVGCGETTVNVQTKLSFQTNWDWEDVKPYVEKTIDDYFKELSAMWETSDNDGLIVRISQIETRLLDLEGIIDISDTTLNGDTQNLTIDVDNIPVRGSVTNV